MRPNPIKWTCPTCGERKDFNAIQCRACWLSSLPALDERLWSKIAKGPGPNACWPQTRGLTGQGGYGVVGTGGRNQQGYSHHVAYQLRGGVIPLGWFVCHTCDNPPCCRNDGPEGTYEVDGISYIRFGHLFAAPKEANRRDMVHKGRGASGDRNGSRKHPEVVPRGEAQWNAKLTEDDVRAIRAAYIPRIVSHSMLGRRYGVSPTIIGEIIRRTIWAHVK